VFLGFANDRLTDVVVVARCQLADARSGLRRDVDQIIVEFRVGDCAGGNLPRKASNQGQRC
jgi:hypothetical protein